MSLKLKSAYSNVIIGFKNKSLPLGQRSEADLTFLYQRAKDRNITDWLQMFEETPTREEIDSAKEKAFNDKRSIKKSNRNEQ